MSNPFGIVETSELSTNAAKEIPTSKAFENFGRVENTCIKLNAINEDLVGSKHPETGVSYRLRRFSIDGQMYEGGFPEFQAAFEKRLPKDMYLASDDMQFKYCTESLARAIDKNPDLASKFTPRQLEQIRNGEPRIQGWTWHHKEYPPGQMQLVNSDIHSKSRHTGGRAIWGGGSECR